MNGTLQPEVYMSLRNYNKKICNPKVDIVSICAKNIYF